MALRVKREHIQRTRQAVKVRSVVHQQDGCALLFLHTSRAPQPLPPDSQWVPEVRLSDVSPEATSFEACPAREGARFTYSELFCGIGGFSVALRRLGGSCVFASEVDAQARRVFRNNFGATPAGNIYDHHAAPVGSHTLLTAGFPCQSFTIAARDAGGLADPRGQLFFELLRFVRECRPRSFLLENVPNLLKHRADLSTIVDALRSLGYSLEYRVIDSSSLVPQNRSRLWFVGFEDARAAARFQWPEVGGPPLPAGAVLEDNVGNEYLLTESHLRQLRKHNKVSERILNPAEPSRTIVSGYLSTGRNTQLVGPEQSPRFYTEREVARLQGFPEDFDISQANNQPRRFYHQCGNAVPPPVVEIIAAAILQALEIR